MFRHRWHVTQARHYEPANCLKSAPLVAWQTLELKEFLELIDMHAPVDLPRAIFSLNCFRNDRRAGRAEIANDCFQQIVVRDQPFYAAVLVYY